MSVSVLQEVGGEAVAQRVRRHPLADPGGLGRGMDGAVQLAGGDRRRPGCGPGNSQPCGSITPRRLPSRHQARSSSSSCGDSMAWRSLRALALLDADQHARRCRYRSTLSATTSDTRSPAP